MAGVVTTAAFTIEVVLRLNGEVEGVRQACEWVAVNDQGARHDAWDMLNRATKTVADLHELMGAEDV